MIEVRAHGGISEIFMANPPVNALSAPLRLAIWQALDAAQADPAVEAIILTGQGACFCGGADINELERQDDPWLPDLIDRIEALPKPVIALVNGLALGGGLELAMGCHYRISVTGARLGLPEVKLGILPGAGGTQRLPRLVGALAALEMITFGEPITAVQAAAAGLVDHLVDAGTGAADLLDHVRGIGAGRRTGELPVIAAEGVLQHFVATNARKLQGLEAPQACLAAVQAAMELPFREGLQKEGALFAALVTGEQSLALRHLFFAERAIGKVAGIGKDMAHRPVRHVGIVGGGTMGCGIALNFLARDLPVTLLDMTPEALGRAKAAIDGILAANIDRGRMTAAQAERAGALLRPTQDFDDLAGCDLIIEAVYEDMALKKSIFARLDEVAHDRAILASNRRCWRSLARSGFPRRIHVVRLLA